MPEPLSLWYSSTHHYLVPYRGGWLLVDPGWAGSLPRLRHALRQMGLDGSAIGLVMLTHHRPDHAGLTQEIKREIGARLVIHEAQLSWLAELAAFHHRKGDRYETIVVGPADLVVTTDSSRDALRRFGIAGQIVHTPGHSPDCVSLVLDDGTAFIGDLHLPNQVEGEMLEAVRRCWLDLLVLGVRAAYPAHGGPISSKVVEAVLEGAGG